MCGQIDTKWIEKPHSAMALCPSIKWGVSCSVQAFFGVRFYTIYTIAFYRDMEWLCTAHSGATSVSIKCNARFWCWLSMIFGRNSIFIKCDGRIWHGNFSNEGRRPDRLGCSLLLHTAVCEPCFGVFGQPSDIFWFYVIPNIFETIPIKIIPTQLVSKWICYIL